MSSKTGAGITAAVVVAALGYFVDVYDMLLFSVVRVPSLKSLGFSGPDLLSNGVFLINMQMVGMLLGGVLWGIWGDKKGRVSVLFGSILLYSLANIANGFVQSINGYAALRFLAGLGLAGELGAGITLVAESMKSASRGYGTTLVATVGVGGAVVAALVSDLFDWRTSYFVGGGMGLLVLLTRVLVHESGLFATIEKDISRGSLLLLLRSPERALRYLSCILVGVPIWFAVGILVTFSPEIGTALGMTPAPLAANAVLYTYVGFVVGDLASGLLSQYLRSRRAAIRIFLVLSMLSFAFYLSGNGMSTPVFHAICIFLGFAGGYWAVFVTTAAEQFGTNLRATVTTSVPNFVRGATVPMTMAFRWLQGETGIIASAAIVGGCSLLIAVFALSTLKESFGRDLNFVEN